MQVIGREINEGRSSIGTVQDMRNVWAVTRGDDWEGSCLVGSQAAYVASRLSTQNSQKKRKDKNKENSRLRVHGFKGREKRKEKHSGGWREKEWGAQENAKCQMRGKGLAPLRDVMPIF